MNDDWAELRIMIGAFVGVCLLFALVGLLAIGIVWLARVVGVA